jgi:hypothetical protein
MPLCTAAVGTPNAFSGTILNSRANVRGANSLRFNDDELWEYVAKILWKNSPRQNLHRLAEIDLFSSQRVEMLD